MTDDISNDYAARVSERQRLQSPGYRALQQYEAARKPPPPETVPESWLVRDPAVAEDVPDLQVIEAREAGTLQPREVAQDDPGFLDTAGEIARDVLRPVIEPLGVGSPTSNWIYRSGVGGASDAAQGVLDLSNEIRAGLGQRPMAVEIPEIPEGDGAAEGMLRGVSQFLSGFAGAGGFLKGANYASRMASGGFADALFDPTEGNLSSFLRELNVDNALVEFLDSRVDEDATSEERLQSRLKTVLEGAGIGATFDVSLQGLRWLKANRQMITDKLADGGNAVLDVLAPESDAPVKVLFPRQSGQITYHGSPHKWDAPSIEAVGTGEGAQAYGNGFYSADAPDVADQYRVNLSYDPDDMRIGKTQINKYYDSLTRIADRSSGEKAQKFYERAGLIERLMDNESPESVRTFAEELGHADWFDSEIAPNFQTYGHLYKLDIPDEDVARYLDWDKPLSEQPDVWKKLQKEFPFLGEMSHKTGEWALGEIGEGIGGLGQELTRKLQKAGIPGIRYLDGNSRDVGQGTYNYVTFDPSRVRVIDRNGKPVARAGKTK